MRRPGKDTLLALGANVSGRWGDPRASLARACRELEAAGVKVKLRSKLYQTKPVGVGRQPHYLNAVIAVDAPLAPAALLRLVKSVERRAGRRLGRQWGPRPLDIDILDDRGWRLGWPGRGRSRHSLSLPHLQLHRRAFVLVPLIEIAPHWHHPVLQLKAKALLARLAPAARRDVRQTLDSAGWPCEKMRK